MWCCGKMHKMKRQIQIRLSWMQHVQKLFKYIFEVANLLRWIMCPSCAISTHHHLLDEGTTLGRCLQRSLHWISMLSMVFIMWGLVPLTCYYQGFRLNLLGTGTLMFSTKRAIKGCLSACKWCHHGSLHCVHGDAIPTVQNKQRYRL